MNNLERLPEEARDLIALYIVKIEEAEYKKRDLVRELADIIEQRGWIPAQYIASFLKKILREIVSESSIDKALGKKHKQQKIRNLMLSDDKKEIEVSTNGMVNPNFDISGEPHRPEFDLEPGIIPTKEEILETSTDIAVNTIVDLEGQVRDLEIRLNEALNLADKKQNEIEQLQLSLGEFELQLRDKMNEIASISELQQENTRLKNALREYVKKQEFTTAAKIESPSTVWVQALNCFGFARSLMQISMKLSDHSARLKVLFDIAADGSIKNPRLEEEDAKPQT